MSVSIAPTHANEITILARILGDEQGRLPDNLARYIIDREFSAHDKARMHDLASRNKRDALSPAEKDELLAYGKAGDLLSILKSKARRSLRIKLKRRTVS
jgi:hypothetical protein